MKRALVTRALVMLAGLVVMAAGWLAGNRPVLYAGLYVVLAAALDAALRVLPRE